MFVGWKHGSNVGLQEGAYRHSSHAAGRVPRQHQYSRYGKGDSEIVTVWRCASMCLVVVRVVVVVGKVIVVADVGTYLVYIFVTIDCIMLSLLHYCIWLLMIFIP